MLAKLLSYGVHKTVRGPAQSWFITSGLLMLLRWSKRMIGRRELVELTDIKPGDRYVIESLHITHGEQMKEEKLAKKSAKLNAKSQKKATKAARKAAKRS